jgi:hypothetical protein
MASFKKFSVVVGAIAAAGAAVAAFVKRDHLVAMVKGWLGRDDDAPPSGPVDSVEESSQESFPASDPPSYGPGV